MSVPRQEVVERFQRPPRSKASGVPAADISAFRRYFRKRPAADISGSTQEDDKENEEPTFASEADYWDHRTEKLKQQAAKPKYSLLSGIAVYIDGSTGRICHYTLVKLIQRYGGTVLNMPSKTKCTHILAKNLNGSKIDSSIKDGLKIPVVDPEWILACIKQKKLLPVHKYLTVRDPELTTLDESHL
eukprot:gb/GECG01010267.1/.p1 GENE.gb/GECG01010267.1/~~gb/GECG01010267.1/.p1  ORF type:complete len:187 (+),score=27.51 gb/GECG01010267.1/:1-561(+)